MSILRDAKVDVYRTDLQGTITIGSDGQNFTVGTEHFVPDSQLNPTDPSASSTAQQAYIGNVNSKKFHLPTCANLPAGKNQILFSSYNEAIAAGYTPCASCIKYKAHSPGHDRGSFYFSLFAGLIKAHKCGILNSTLFKRSKEVRLMAIGVPRPLALEKPQAVDLAQAARYFGAHGDPDAATLALLQKCAVPLLAAATPRAVWLLADTPALTDAGLLPGEDVHKHLKGCGQAILLAVTLGPGVDAQIRRAGVGDIAAGVASDALGSALAEQTVDAAEAQLRQWAATEGKYLTGRFSPGYGDWDIAVQPLVAAALDTVRKAGLCVTDTNLMTPRKSVTALLGVSDHPVKGQLAGCGHCVLRTRCEYRKRGKTCASE